MRLGLLLLSAGAALASGQTAEIPAQAGTVFTRESMVAEINPAAVEIWDVSNNALSDSGALDPALMNDAAWARLEEAARMLERLSGRLHEHVGSAVIGSRHAVARRFCQVQVTRPAD